ncbi:MAG: hypothetical protein U0Z17_05850 [Bacteroidales bacterium]
MRTTAICGKQVHQKKGQLIYESKKSAAYPGEAIGEKLYIFTNDNALNYRLLVADKKS